MNNIISIENGMLRKGNKEILQDINWTIQEGEHWGLLGLNGSGKTSLLNIISAYQFPSSGEVHVLGKQFGKTSLPELRKEIGFVSNSLDRFAQFFQNETVERIIVSGKFASFGIHEKVLQEDWERANALLEQLRLTHLKGKSYQLLSEGEKRRVLIARSIMSDPKMLILDEPCSGLDILSREQFLQSVNQVIENKCHVVYVTHHIEELVEGISHVLLLKDGKIVAAGPKKEVLQEDLLSETFQVPVRINWEDGRPLLGINKTPMGI
ncbi:ABC transporter ATP-binding protein [Sporosarcina sp. HYO08]|uniref:ABC transporter ATP-binding protein n=1 Tax=Sporosarcina sp. HYO08 TaxID=1759557 RepID=UPI000794AD1E|nr:ABC transporter ATP-binding protein [Sporosarcina sp. HYO08]KXH87056.1 molybdenum ABC transporter ATP-binding protein [Sporosarcina sp. HYO08]